MTTTGSPQPSSGTGTQRRILERIGWVVASLLALYAVLLIPFGGDGPAPPAEQQKPKQPFAWNNDEFWKSLEENYRSLKHGGCETAAPTLDSSFQEATSLLHSIEGTHLGPDAQEFRDLESLIFKMGPIVSACDSHVKDYVAFIADMRTGVKLRSVDWDMTSPSARTTLYRLLYGSRAAAEEVILQVPASTTPLLVPGKDEPSQTPWADVRAARIHSGDILVSRGGAPTSALIARGSDYPGNFSHIAFVYVDPDTRTANIVEAHIERGVVVSTVEEYLNDKKLRVMLLRPRADLPQLVKNPMLPHEAAKRAYERATREHVPYDFEMNYRDHTELFCSEVASAEYEALGMKLWMGISHLSAPGLQKWLRAFGVRYFETQEPSDLEYDPQLVVVAEWRDPQELRKDHYDNAATDVMLEGAEQGDVLKYQRQLLPLSRAAKAYSVVLNLLGKAGPVPEGMSATAALRNVWYTAKHDAIVALLAKKAEEFRKEHEYAPPYWELVKLAREAKSELSANGG